MRSLLNRIFKQKEPTLTSDAEARFMMVFDIVKDLSGANFDKFIEGIKQAHDGYYTALKSKSESEKEDEKIAKIEKELNKSRAEELLPLPEPMKEM